MRGKFTLFLIGVLLGAVLVGSQYWVLREESAATEERLESRAETAERRVAELEQQLRVARLRNRLGELVSQVRDQNFGQARSTATDFFNDLRVTAAAEQDAAARRRLEEILGRRDELTADLTSLNPATTTKLQDLHDNFLQPKAAEPAPAP